MADNVELRIVLVDENGVGTRAPGQGADASPGSPLQSPFSFGQTLPTFSGAPATVTTFPQQPVTATAQPQPATFSIPPLPVAAMPLQQPATFSFATPPPDRGSRPAGQPDIGPDSKETRDIFSFKPQTIDAKAKLTSDTYSFEKPPEPMQPSKTPKEPMTVSEEAQKIFEKRQRDQLVQKELDKLDPPKSKPDYSATTKAFNRAGNAAATAGFRKSASTLFGAADIASKGGAAALNPGALAATLALDGMTDAARAVAGGLQEIAFATTSLARGQNFQSITRVVDDATAAIGKIPYVGGVLEGALEIATVGVKSFTATVQAFIDRGAELAKFSPEISAARAGSEVRQMQGDLREAQALGPGIARLTEIQSEMSDELREILLPIKKAIIEDIGPLLQKLSELMGQYGPQVALGLTNLYEEIKIRLEWWTGQWDQAARDREALPRKLAEVWTALNKKEPKNPAAGVLKKLMDAAIIDLGKAAQNPKPLQPKQVRPAFGGPDGGLNLGRPSGGLNL